MSVNTQFSPMLLSYKDEVQTTPSVSVAKNPVLTSNGDKDVVELSYGEKTENIKKLEEKKEKVMGQHGLLRPFELNTPKIKNKLLKNIAGLVSPVAYLNRDVVESYKDGEISYQEADRLLSVQDKTNDMTVNIVSNVAASFLATSAGILLKGKAQLSSHSIMALSAGIGAFVNTGIKFIDRLFNKKKNDEFNAKNILTDLGAGAFNGLLSGWNVSRGGTFTKTNVAKKIGFGVAKQGAIVVSAKILSDKKETEET